ncbi:unnamed protein product [Hymenolepis diminuta]|uniref:Uncharacterized protein n=1 Tax=Hymenolepis diminuta TaxID=6216 RepID=A0A564Z7M1_HYMDI|nr:unnamed protein product [Hymenolepis diminuta]
MADIPAMQLGNCGSCPLVVRSVIAGVNEVAHNKPCFESHFVGTQSYLVFTRYPGILTSKLYFWVGYHIRREELSIGEQSNEAKFGKLKPVDLCDGIRNEVFWYTMLLNALSLPMSKFANKSARGERKIYPESRLMYIKSGKIGNE